MVKVIPLKYGPIFKQIFGQVEVFKAFVKDVVGVDLDIDHVQMEYEYPEGIGFVKTRYDLFAEDVGKCVIVEIQQVKEGDFFDRFLYYHLISLAEQVKSYDAYWFDRVVYTIVVLTSVPQDKSVNFSVAVSSMNPVTETGQTLESYPHRLVFLVPRLVNEQTPPLIREWLELIKDSLDKEMDETAYTRPLFQEIIQAMRATTASPETLLEMKDERAWELVQAWTWEEGMEHGIEQGIEQGARLKAIEIARQLLDVLDDETISLKTGLTVDQVRQLREN